MANRSFRNPISAPGGDRPAHPLVSAPTPPPPPALIDRNGFDPNDFEWRPVPRRPRADGWTPEAQQRFIQALARTGIVERACEEVGLSVRSAYNLRNAQGGEGFARAWAAVLTKAADRLLDVAFEQAIEGEEIPIFDQDGVRTGSKRRYNTRMAMFLLRAYHPDRFRHANRDARDANEPPPPAAEPVPAITATLAPVTPADPAMLAAPDRLDDMLDAAQALADHDASHPRKEEEPYAYPKREPQHPKVALRARNRRDRRARRVGDADEGHSDDDYEAGDGAALGSYESDFEY